MPDYSSPKHKLHDLIKSLKPSEVLTRDSSDYAYHSLAFSAHRERFPSIVFAPESVESLSRIVRELYVSDVDFDIRGHGFKFNSGCVVVSMVNFNGFEYDRQSKLATIGVGLTWSEVCHELAKVDPEYTTLVARTAVVGVGGCVLLGGYSWRSGALGCISDPANFLDAEVVKNDGSVVMASSEPDLMWGLRGGGGGFGVVTKVILRAHPCSTKIWAGNILVPRSELSRIARGMTQIMERDDEPGVTGFLYIMRDQVSEALRGQDDQKDGFSTGENLVIYAYDEYGEEHGRRTFQFALDAPGAVDLTKVTNMEGVTNGQANVGELRGKTRIEFQTIALEQLSYELIMKSAEWFDTLPSYGGSIAQTAMLAFEFKALGPINGGTTASCAYPRPPNLKHILLIGTGCRADASAEEQAQAHQVTLNAPRAIMGDDVELHITAAGLEDWHDKRVTYGENYDKLVQVRQTHDPKGRFKALVPVS
ncbi:hypothetical protein BKA63DRAFT_525809 [Paraphoma chrysanthemicola]|nr:hypothetical protein BKA63DRAFT_525809 [Paraphoma chrysanthemicola]